MHLSLSLLHTQFALNQLNHQSTTILDFEHTLTQLGDIQWKQINTHQYIDEPDPFYLANMHILFANTVRTK